jgi:RNA polymerase sigma factor (sigma-70 family)
MVSVELPFRPEAFFEKNKDYWRGWILNAVKNRKLTEEILQNAFLKMLSNWNQCRSEVTRKGWANRVVLNEIYNAIRKRKREARAAHDNNVEDVVGSSTGGLTTLLKTEMIDAMRKAKSTLTSKQQKLCDLRMDGTKHEDIARLLGFSNALVSRHEWDKIKKLLKDALHDDME